MDGIATTVQLGAQVMGLDTNPYGGKGAFSQTETGESGQLNLIAVLKPDGLGKAVDQLPVEVVARHMQQRHHLTRGSV